MDFYFDLVAPDGRIFQCDNVEYVVIPAAEGEITAYKNHIPFISEILCGKIKIVKKHEYFEFFVSKGYVQINKNNVIALVEKAIKFGEHEDLIYEILSEAKEMKKNENILSPMEISDINRFVNHAKKYLDM